MVYHHIHRDGSYNGSPCTLQDFSFVSLTFLFSIWGPPFHALIVCLLLCGYGAFRFVPHYRPTHSNLPTSVLPLQCVYSTDELLCCRLCLPICSTLMVLHQNVFLKVFCCHEALLPVILYSSL